MATLNELIQERLRALANGLLAWPTGYAWLISLLVMLLYGGAALWVGLRSGLIKQRRNVQTTSERILIGARLLLHPALVEEVIFRGLLLPPPSNVSFTTDVVFWFSLSLLSFILAHPLNGHLLRRNARHVFTNPTFLTLAGLLGLCASVLYWISASLWPPIILHWMVVYVWLTNYGGLAALSGRT
jgi:predicted Abi (CAAX) family protease